VEPISIYKFARSYVKNNPSESLEDVILSLKEAVRHKKAGGKCIICGNPIWAIGSAIVGTDMCFTCITGEADQKEDYEIDEVCWL
jgi:predicted transcriptional regulator